VSAAGIRTEPPVSLPSPPGASRAPTAAPVPLELPAGDTRPVVRVARADRLRREEALVVSGNAEGQLVHVGLAENDRAGVDELLRGRGARGGDEPAQRRRPGRVRQPGTWMLSFTTSGTP